MVSTLAGDRCPGKIEGHVLIGHSLNAGRPDAKKINDGLPETVSD